MQLLTRLPVPLVARLRTEEVRDGLTRIVTWMPLVGTLIGGVTAGVFLLALRVWPPLVAAGIALIAEALLTGAFHEDAVADFCDAFGGSASGDEARRIMRDSRVGSYGALGLLLLVGLRWVAMAALPPPLAGPAIVAAATLGRLLPAGLLALAPPTADGKGLGTSVGTPTIRTLPSALLLGIPGTAPIAIAEPAGTACAVLAGLALLGWMAWLVRRRLGGSTGDCLGFSAYIGQLAVLLAALAS